MIKHINNLFQFIFQSAERYGIDFEGPQPTEEFDGPYTNSDETIAVEVPHTEMPMTPEAYDELSHSINPLRNSEFHGVDIYLEVLQFLTTFRI